jgi:hypothetical protein
LAPSQFNGLDEVWMMSDSRIFPVCENGGFAGLGRLMAKSVTAEVTGVGPYSYMSQK